ncbi:hypothetical protein JYK04_06297 [Streptomyces nojiriensis]|nr:hypothetical protein JYK04_06297 [Streptomyces nojiriensis]
MELKVPLTCGYVGFSPFGAVSMTRHVECVAMLEPVAKGA